MSKEKWWELTPLQIVHLLLLLVTMWGLFGVCSYSHELRILNAQKARLLAELGDFSDCDPTKFKLLKLQCDDPQEATWRIEAPHDYNPTFTPRARLSETDLIQTIAPNAIADGGIFRCKIESAGDDLFLYYTGPGGSHRWKIDNPDTRRLLQAHWDELQFEYAASDEIYEFGEDEIVSLIRVTAPPELKSELVNQDPADDTPVLWIRIGSEKATKKVILSLGAEGQI